MSWLVLAAISAAFLGLYDVSKKAALNANAVLPVLFLTSLSGSVVVLVGILASWAFPSQLAALDLTMEPLSAKAHGLILIKAVIVSLSWVLTYFAVKHLPISIASPVRASAPLFTLLGAVVFFGEAPSARQWFGIALVLAAYWGLSLIGRAEGIRFEKDRWIALLVAGTLVGALSSLYDKHLVQGAHLHPTTMQCWFTLYNAAIQGALVAFLWYPRRASHSPLDLRPSIGLVGVLLLVADNLYFRALAYPDALISVVSMIRRTNVIISFAVGALMFRERLLRQKSLALGSVLVGLWLLLG